MKEISEEIQMRIFDLLEGNLSPLEEEQIRKEIENSAALKEEYKLMRMTYLQVEEKKVLPMAFKESLYKKKKVIPMVFYARVATVAALIGIGSFAVYKGMESNPTQYNNNEVAYENTPKNEIVEPLNPVVVKEFEKKEDAINKIAKSKIPKENKNYTAVSYSMVVNRNAKDTGTYRTVAAVEFAKEDTFTTKGKEENAPINTALASTKSNKRSWRPVEVILIDEPMISNPSTSNSTTQASLASRILKSTKENIRRGQTPDIDIKFNRKKLKFDFDFIPHKK